MTFLQKLRTFVKRCGTPAKFVAKSIIGVAIPGSGPVLELIDKAIDCAHETARDNLEALASPEDLDHLEKMFDVLLGEMQGVVDHLRRLEDMPDLARETLNTALSIKPHCIAAAKMLRDQGIQLSAMQTELKKLATGQEDLRDVYRRLYGAHLDYIEEQRLHHVSPAELDERLKRIEEGILAVRGGAAERAEAIFSDLSAKQPESAVLTVAVAASQAAGYKFDRVVKTLQRASQLSPGDVKLAEMSRVATEHWGGDTPPPQPPPPAIKRPMPGDTLDGWVLEKLLGRGGWGQVFLARKGNLTRALKIMHAELSRDAEFVKRFKREMGTLIGLGAHPHLVRIDPDHLFDKAHDWNCWYYVMEYVEGATLERYLEKQGALTLGQARALFTGIAEGLAIAHARGIIHRDVKPANILLRKKPEPGQGKGVLVDFGLAGLVDTHLRGAGYTALFAAPEQMRHGVSDCRSDVYSLAATLYYCLLFSDADKRGRFKAKLLPDEVPADLRALLERCLDNDPDERPRDAGAFVKEWSRSKPAEAIPIQQTPAALPTTHTNGLGAKLVLVPRGTFWMGGGGGEAGNTQFEIPYDFYIGSYPVTQAEWQAVMGSNPSHFSRSGGGKDNVKSISDADLKMFPVENVSWEDAQVFLQKLNAREKPSEWVYRLPTEAEWEYACREGASSKTDCSYHFYLDKHTNDLSASQANFDGNHPAGTGAKAIYLQRTSKVGSYKPNKLGIYDMHGNVWEWCNDAEGSERVIRGGGWRRDGGLCRAAYRGSRAPSSRRFNLGLRLALVPSGQV